MTIADISTIVQATASIVALLLSYLAIRKSSQFEKKQEQNKHHEKAQILRGGIHLLLLTKKELMRLSATVTDTLSHKEHHVLGNGDVLQSWINSSIDLCREQIDYAAFPCSTLAINYRVATQAAQEISYAIRLASSKSNRNPVEVKNAIARSKTAHKVLKEQIATLNHMLALLNDSPLDRALASIEASNTEALRIEVEKLLTADTRINPIDVTPPPA